MIKKSTILSRFTKAFGEPKMSKTGLYIMGGDLDIFGLTTKLSECTQGWIRKWYSDTLTLPKAEIVNGSKFCTDYSFITGFDDLSKVEVIFTEDKILAGYHILDSKPFERLEIQYFPNCSLPIAASREIEGQMISILIAPFEVPYFHGNPWLTGKTEIRWLKPLYNTTFWLVECDKYSRRGVKIGITRDVKCYNCRVELTLQDYTNQVLLRNHPECVCSCSTYDDFCGCLRKRNYIQMMTEARKLAQMKMRVRKELS